MELQFTKMHALGNDFVIIDSLHQKLHLRCDQIRLIADRHLGVGCDQLLLLRPTNTAGVDVRYIIYNADGEEVSQCGNGARCIAAYLHKNVLLEQDTISAETAHGILTMYYQDDEHIKVDMGIPRLAPTDIPIATDDYAVYYQLNLADTTITFSAISIGNPHAVIIVDDIDAAPISSIGYALQQHEFFLQGVNVGFMQIIDNNHIKLRVYERGCGETLACGSGACAAVVAGNLTARLTQQVEVTLPGGQLSINWLGQGESIWMTGPATFVYSGTIPL